MPPVAPGMTIVATLAGLLATLASAAHGSTLLVAVPPGAVFKLTGTPIVVDGVNLRLTSTGAGAVLDAQHLSRCIEVQNEGVAQLENFHLRNGRVIDRPGGCALVNGSQSTLTLEGGSLVSCESLMDQFVPPRVSLHGGPYGEVWEASGGGVAVGYGARVAIQSALFEDCGSSLYGGGVFAYQGADVVVRGTDFKQCNAAFGGGVASFSAGTQVLVAGCSIIGSDVLWNVGARIPMRQGGGLAVSYLGSADVVDSLIANHTLLDGGGAFIFVGGEKLTLTGTTVRDCVFGLVGMSATRVTPQLTVARSLFQCTRPLLLSTAGVFWGMASANYTFLDTVLDGCKGRTGAIHQMAGSFYGRNLTIRDCHTGDATSNQGAGGLTFGGYGTRLRPTAVLEDSTIERCTNGAGGAGGLHVYKASCVMRRVSISNCHSLQGAGGGGVRVGEGGSTTLLAGSISRCSSTAGSGGAVLVETDGTFVIAERSLLANCTAKFGGLLAVVGGNALLEDAELSRGQTWPGNQDADGGYPASGGCIYAAADVGQVPVGAVVTLVRSTVRGCIAGVAGEDNASALLSGAPCPAVFQMGNSAEVRAAKPWPTLGRGSGVLVDGGPTRVTLVESELIDNVADSGGGAHVQDGTLRLEHGSSIRRCTACNRGGGVEIAAGRLQLVRSAIHECRALGFGGGGISMSPQESGKVELTSVIIARCAAPAVGSEGAAIRTPKNMVARNLTISECDPEGGETFALRLRSTSDITLLTLIPPCHAMPSHPVLSDDRDDEHRYRVTGLRVLPAHGCAVHADTDALMAAALDNVLAWSTTAHGCASNGSVCGEHASCSDVLVSPGASLTSPECTCAPPNILPDAAADVSRTLMPYSEGCLTPRFGASLDVANRVAASVVLRLAKPENASRVLRLQTGGTAAANVTWSIDPSSMPPWLVVDALSGRVDALTETRREILTLTASTVGLAESREPYEAILHLTSVSMLTTHFEVPVLLFVTAAAHAATSKWGRTAVPGDCTIMDGSADFEIAITHGETHRVSFTAWRTSMCKAGRGLLVVPTAR